jgi:hypothetical protein
MNWSGQATKVHFSYVVKRSISLCNGFDNCKRSSNNIANVVKEQVYFLTDDQVKQPKFTSVMYLKEA